MPSTKFLTIRGRIIRTTCRTQIDGFRDITFQCCDKYCPHRCAMSIKMPAGLWSVKLAEIAEKSFSPCKRLEKMVTEIAKQDGRLTLVSLVKREAS